MKVCKFGGTSVGTVERMKHVAELISESTPKIVVLSATAGTTNHLEEIAASLFNRDIEQAHEKITRLEFQFIDFANELLTDESTKREAIDYILDRFQRLWQFINDEFTSVEEKEVLAQGELISTALLHFYLRERKIANILLSAFDFMRTGPEGEPDLKYIEEKLQVQLAQYPGINLFITQGYICKNAYNETEMLYGAGSRYFTRVIIVHPVNVRPYLYFLCADGSADERCRIVAAAPFQFISKIFDTFAKYRTPLCLLVSSNQDVSIAIDNSEHLCKILAELEQYAKILMEDRMSIVSVVGNMRWQYAGVEAQIIEALADIPLRMISYGSNDSDVAFVIKTEDKKRALQALSNRLFEPETDKIVK